ncbi:MAG: cytochrome b/b6 domain-containing protein [Mariprofundaceae bacterium]
MKGYHPITRWLHAGLILGVLFQLTFAALMAHPDHHGSESNGQAPLQSMASIEVTHHDRAHELPLTDVIGVEGSHLDQESDKLGDVFMQSHRMGGLLVVFIVLLNVIWAIARRGSPRKRQCSVLYSKQHWCEALKIAKHVPMMVFGKRALVEPGNSLSLIVEMLGLLTMAAMAVTGLMIWNLWGGPDSAVSSLAELLMQVHGGFAVLLFVYLAGHVSMALLHKRSGDRVFSRILPWGSH